MSAGTARCVKWFRKTGRASKHQFLSLLTNFSAFAYITTKEKAHNPENWREPTGEQLPAHYAEYLLRKISVTPHDDDNRLFPPERTRRENNHHPQDPSTDSQAVNDDKELIMSSDNLDKPYTAWRFGSISNQDTLSRNRSKETQPFTNGRSRAAQDANLPEPLNRMTGRTQADDSDPIGTWVGAAEIAYILADALTIYRSSSEADAPKAWETLEKIHDALGGGPGVKAFMYFAYENQPPREVNISRRQVGSGLRGGYTLDTEDESAPCRLPPRSLALATSSPLNVSLRMMTRALERKRESVLFSTPANKRTAKDGAANDGAAKRTCDGRKTTPSLNVS